jgi:hypothetical protein
MAKRFRAGLAGRAGGRPMLTRNAPTGIDPDERRQPMAGFQGQRLMGFTPDSYNADTRTVEAVLSRAARCAASSSPKNWKSARRGRPDPRRQRPGAAARQP